MSRKSSPLVEFVTEFFQPLGQITSRSMFGGYCIYCDGTVFAIVAGNALFLKADDENRPQFVARGLLPFRPFEGEGSMSYYQAPPEVFEDTDAMKEWGGSAVSAGRRASQSRPPRARKRRAQ